MKIEVQKKPAVAPPRSLALRLHMDRRSKDDGRAITPTRLRLARRDLRQLSRRKRRSIAFEIPPSVRPRRPLRKTAGAQQQRYLSPLGLLSRQRQRRLPAGVRVLGRGSYGSTFALDCRVHCGLLEAWRATCDRRIDGAARRVPRKGTAVVKLSNDPADDATLEREAAFLAHMARSEGRLFGKRYAGGDVVPPFIFSGRVPTGRAGKFAYVLVYEHEPGLTLKRVFRGKTRATAQLHAVARALRRTLLTLVACNVVHADAHGGNFLWNGRRVLAIDFGFAVSVPERVVRPFRSRPLTGPADIDALYSAARPVVDKVLLARGYSEYNPNSALFRELLQF